MKNISKIIASFLLPLLLGLAVFFWFALSSRQALDLELFFSLWLLLLPLSSGFVAGRVYPSMPLRAGIYSGLLLALLMLLPLALWVPVLRSWVLLLVLAAISMAFSLLAALIGAMTIRARALLADEAEEEPEQA